MTKRIAAPPIKPRASSDPAPLSFAQERLWFLEQLEPQSAAYSICRVSRLVGNLNTLALEASINEIINRHETLRTAFRLVAGQPVQVVQPIRNISIESVDLRAIPDDKRDAEIQRRIKAEAERPFDLMSGSMLRSTLLRAGDQEHVLILMTHHSASDAWSMGILTREMWTLYEAFSNGKPSPFERLAMQYSDYAVWQRNWLQGEVLEAQLDYWKKRLENISIVNLPTDWPRAARQSFRGARVPLTLSQALTASVIDLSNRSAATPFMTLLAAFQLLLYRYTGQEDIVVGSPIANRRRPEIEELIGFFVNALVLRADLSGNPSFRELLSRVKETCVAADSNQDLPFEKLVQELQPERDPSRNPLFQIMFILQNATSSFNGIPSLRVEPIELATTRSPFDISLFLRERDDRYIGYIEYSTDLFNRDRIERMTGHFQTLLAAVVADPDRSIDTLPILTDAERLQILVEWNDTAAEYPNDKCIHELFEEQVERTPDAIAVEFADKQVTYRELNQRANQLAHYLISLGIAPGKLVGICVERSIAMVVGLLGILKAGGAYVPLDPSYPKERLRFMLEDSEITVLLTQEKLVEDRKSRIDDATQLPNRDPLSSILHPRLEVVQLDRDLPIIERQSTENPNSRVDSGNLAYVIYTSGSTGQPKGVAIEHRNTVALLNWAKAIFSSDEISGVLASTSICFDLSVFEMFVPLGWGGKVILVGNALSLQGTEAKGITLVNTVPSAMAALLAAGPLPDSIRVVSLAGEPLKPELVNQLYQTGTVEKVYDLYGPSETTTYSTFTRRTVSGPATIGRPIANTHVYILDSHLQPVPIGVPGELYIGGAGVARGYLRRPELTVEKFISNPFSEDSNLRIYRTGDRARHLPDGNIEFLGRSDDQVKIRGHRIELGEIEATLNLHPAVKESVLVPHEREDASERELWGYVVLDKASASDLSDVRVYLATKLPTFMIPTVLITIDALPLTPNGKIDRSKLPSPEESMRGFGGVPIPPRSEVEELVANIWCDVLQIKFVSVHDNFFALGGHSLLAIQIVSRLQAAFNKEVPLRTLFDAPTIAELGQELESIIRGGHAPDLPPIARVPRDGPLPLSLNQEHLWHCEQRMPGTHFSNMPYVYRLTGELNVDALEKALSEIIRRHEALRTVFHEVDGKPVQIIKSGLDFRLTVADLRRMLHKDLTEKATVRIMEERVRPFDLTTGPLIRATLLRLTDWENLLLITAHHIIADHWSMQIIRRECVTLYEAFSQGRATPLSEPTVQFGDYACWEERLLASGSFKRQGEFWKSQLTEPIAGYQLQAVRAGYAAPSDQFQQVPIEVNEELLEKIKLLATRQNCTSFVVLVATVVANYHLLTGEQNIRVGTTVANRQQETEGTIGHFVNTVILRVKLPPEATLKGLIDRIRTATLVAYSQQEFPMEQLMRELESDQDFDRASLFRVLINYQKHDAKPVNTNGLTFAPWNVPYVNREVELLPTAFDLIFNLKEAPTKLTGTVTYRATMSNQEVAKMLGNFYGILGDMITQPAQQISTVSVNPSV